MEPHGPRFAARARGVRQSLIRQVTRRVEAVGGVNLGQGTCPLPPHPAVLEAAHRAIDAGHHSYTLFDGVGVLKEAVAERYSSYNRLTLDASQILITQGATGGLECACKSFLEPGDECVLFSPIYEYHVRLVLERSGVPVFIPLEGPDWSFDRTTLEQALSRRPKLLILANPNNPTGKVFTQEELQIIGEIAGQYDTVVVVDEVYEYLILDRNSRHVSLASLPGMFNHTLTLSSASKTLFCTGWRVGWCIGPEAILGTLGVKSDETYICAPAPLQHAVADALRMGDLFFSSIKEPFIAKRDRLCQTLASVGLRPLVPHGAYYVLADYRDLGIASDDDAMNILLDRVGVGSIPGSSFVPDQRDTGLLRFCFALPDDLLDRGCELLRRL